MKTAIIYLIVIISILLISCAPSISQAPNDPTIYGFWSGLWHGWILPISFVSSLLHDDIGIYAINNCGHWYDFGFLIGIGTDIFGLNFFSNSD